MELRRRTLRTGTKNVSESTEMAGSSHNGETESFSSESSAAENSSLERLEREKSKSSEDMVASDSSPKGRSSLFRKFRIYLSSLVKRVNVRESTQRSVQGEHCDSSRESGEENTPRRNLFEDEWLQTSEWEQSNKLESQTSDHTKNEHWEEENPSQTEPKQLSVQTSTRGVGSYDYHKALSGSSLEESERGQIITRSRGMQTPANSEHTETTREGNYLLNSAKSEAKGRRKYTRESSGKRPQETSQKPVIVKAKNARKTNSSIQEAARVHDDQLSQALSEDFSETISYQELRSLCKRLGIKATGKKTQLMGKLRHYVKSQETASEASVSRKEKPDLPENTEQKNREVKGPREASISSKLKRGRDREGMKAEISGKTAEHSLYSMETIALARAVLQHLQSQQRTISVEEYELYQNILKNAVQKPSSQLAISEYPFGGAVGSSRVRKRTRTPPSDPKRRKRNQPLSTMKIVEVSIGEDVDSFSSQPIRQPSLKRQRVYSMDVLPFEKVDEHSPKSTPKLTPVPVRPTVSRQTELTGNPLTPVDVVRTFMGSSATEIDKKKSESKPEGSEQGISISGSAFTTPIVSTNRNNSQSSSFVSRKGTLSENRYFRKQDTLQSQPLFSGKSDWTKTADISGLKRNWDIGKERIYDFRKNISPTPSKASASDTARKILETLERIAGNSAERKKPPPVTLDSLRKRHRTEEQNRTQTESKLSQDWNDSCLETGSIHAHHESGRHSNENVKEPRPDNHSEHTLEDQGYNKEFSVNLAKDLFAKHIDTTSRKEVAREVEDKADSTEEPSNTIRTYTKKSNEEQFESQTPQQSYSQHFPVISSITKSLMSDKSIENMVSSPSAKANDNNLDWKTREELKEKDNNLDFRENKKTEEHSRSSLLTSFDSVDHARPNDNNIIEQSENLTDNNAFQKNSVSVINEASSAHATIEARKEQVQDSDTKDDRNSTWTRTNDGHSKNDNFIQNRLESQGESGQDNDEKEEQSTFFTTSHAKDDKSSFLTGSETKGTSDNQTVAATMTSSFSYTSPSMGENFSMFSKPSSFQANILPQSSSHCLVQTGSATSAAWFGSTIGEHFKANSSQSENDRSTLETPSEASTAE
ncbi:peptidase, partial [Galdieria sulphuraria]